MAPLPEETTARYWFDYTTGVNTHTLMVRAADVDVDGRAAVEQGLQQFLTALDPIISIIVIVGSRLSGAGQQFSFPFSSTLLGQSFGSTSADTITDSQAITFVGRGPLGRRTRVSVFGFSGGLSNYRLTAAENSAIGDAAAALNTTEGAFYDISGLKAVWAPYGNIKASDYWVRQAR